MNKNYIGIDPGLNGGICVIENGRILDKIEMPNIHGKDIDYCELFDFLEKHSKGITYCVIEKVHGMAHWGIKNNFNFGGYFEATKAIVKILQIPFTEVSSKKWQKPMFEGVRRVVAKDGKLDTKKTADIAVKKIFPSEDFRHSNATARAKKSHDGIVDATLIALYASRNF